MDIHLIVVPYDSARRAWRMGRGPRHLLRSGLIESLEQMGHTASAATVESSETDAVLSSFDLARQIAGHVDAAERVRAFPIILAGNCIASVGAFAGLESRTAMLWLDAISRPRSRALATRNCTSTSISMPWIRTC